MECLDKIETMLSIIASTFTGRIILAEETNITVNKPQDPKNSNKKILKISTLFNTSIYKQGKVVRSLTTLLQTFQVKFCNLTYYRAHQLVIMMHLT